MTNVTSTAPTADTSNKKKVIKKKVIKSTPDTFTSTDIAKEQGITAKAMRARVRRHLDDWTPLFHAGIKHTFKNNKTTRAKVLALLA